MEQKDILMRKDYIKYGKKRQSSMKRRGINELTQKEKSLLANVYKGAVIEAIEPLEAEESRQFLGGAPLFNFHLQTLYKYMGDLEPSGLVHEIQNLIEHEERLRSNYCYLDGEMCRVVLSRGFDMPNIICQDLRHLGRDELDATLERITEEDMHQQFNLNRGALFRISSFRTGDKEYAVLLTVSQVIAPYLDMKCLLRRLGGGRGFPDSDADTLMNEPDAGKNTLSNDIKTGFPQVRLPYERPPHGDFCQVTYRNSLPGNISSGLLKLVAGSRELLLTVLETAWELLLMESNRSDEIHSPLLLPASEEIPEGFFMISTCLKKTDDVSIERTVMGQAVQIDKQIKYARVFNAGMRCSHFLSFYNFFDDRKSFSDSEAFPEGAVVCRNLWAASGVKMGVYFRWNGNKIVVEFLYDKSCFKPYSIELIFQKYLQFLQKVLFDWKQPVSNFVKDLSDSAVEEGNVRHYAVKDDSRNGLYNVISELALIKGVQPETLRRDIANPKRLVYMKGNQISGRDIEENFLFLVEGRALRSISSGGALYNYLDIRTSDSWLNESVLMSEKKSRLAIDIMSEEATVLLIPIAEMNRLMNDEPHIMRRMLLSSVSEMEKYQRLWTQM